MNNQLDPTHIMQTATAFWPSNVLLTAVELNLFTALANGPLPAQQLGNALGLHPPGTCDLFDALVTLNLRHREGGGAGGQ